MATIFSPSSEDARYMNGSSSHAESKSPLTNFGFLKNLAEKKTNRDGQPQKKRGPKPDSKPALTRRQELNRQAQRTHRERKEMYIKALEQDVLRLKETFVTTVKERDAYAEENRKLKELLASHGIILDGSNLQNISIVESPSYVSSTGSRNGSYANGASSTGYTSTSSLPHGGSVSNDLSPIQLSPGQAANPGMNYDQLGIDFVLTLERPCMDHAQFLMVRALEADDNISGHALMASCPPDSHIVNHPDVPYPHQMPDVAMPDLMRLLDLSNRLPLDGEITPIMAWAMILKDPRFTELSEKDITRIKEDLSAKVRCYGFGAVLEEFEVRDAMMAAFAGKAGGLNVVDGSTSKAA